MMKFGNVILCEYAAQDQNNKHILAGIYSGDIIVESFPANLRLALYVEATPDKAGDYDTELTMKLNGERALSAKARAEGMSADTVSVFVLGDLGLQIKTEATLEIEVSVNAEPSVLLLTKKIYKRSNANDSSASPPPSEQSPPAARG